ncbi:MAG: hypothetical protein ABSF53_22695 [Terracidiphilus sp.]
MKAVENSLGPHLYQNRAPFCAASASAEAIKLAKCDTQAVMDEEIAYAAKAHLAYWAYCWYGSSDAMMNAWALHQSSSQKNRVNWCMILQFSRVGADFTSLASTHVGYFRQPNYQKVADGRPLLYLFVDQLEHLTHDFGGSWANVRKGFDSLNTACTNEGLARPYLVVMYGWPQMAHDLSKQLNGDAISNYMARVPPGKPAAYEALDASAQAYWAEMAATGSAIVPICLTGWDTRPRKQHPPFWQSDQRPNVDMDAYVVAGTPAQIAGQVQEAIEFVKTHAEICVARTALIYSWNECDEGGSTLVPTYAAAGPNHATLDAVGAVLRKY